MNGPKRPVSVFYVTSEKISFQGENMRNWKSSSDISWFERLGPHFTWYWTVSNENVECVFWYDQVHLCIWKMKVLCIDTCKTQQMKDNVEIWIPYVGTNLKRWCPIPGFWLTDRQGTQQSHQPDSNLNVFIASTLEHRSHIETCNKLFIDIFKDVSSGIRQ